MQGRSRGCSGTDVPQQIVDVPVSVVEDIFEIGQSIPQECVEDFGDVLVPSRPDHTVDALLPHFTELVEDVQDISLLRIGGCVCSCGADCGHDGFQSGWLVLRY